MALSRDSGVDQPLLSRLARGASPGFSTATKLKRWIPFAWWTQPAPDSEPPPDDDEQTTPLLERPPLGEAGPESESPLEPKYPPSTPPPPPPSEEEERASQRPRTGSSDPFGYA